MLLFIFLKHWFYWSHRNRYKLHTLIIVRYIVIVPHMQLKKCIVLAVCRTLWTHITVIDLMDFTVNRSRRWIGETHRTQTTAEWLFAGVHSHVTPIIARCTETLATVLATIATLLGVYNLVTAQLGQLWKAFVALVTCVLHLFGMDHHVLFLVMLLNESYFTEWTLEWSEMIKRKTWYCGLVIVWAILSVCQVYM